MLARKQRDHLRIGQDRREEAARDVTFQQPITVLCEHVTSQTGASIAKPTNQRNSMCR